MMLLHFVQREFGKNHRDLLIHLILCTAIFLTRMLSYIPSNYFSKFTQFQFSRHPCNTSLKTLLQDEIESYLLKEQRDDMWVFECCVYRDTF